MMKLSLFFSGEATSPELVRTIFQHPDTGAHSAVRGQTGGAHAVDCSFTWSAGLKALTILLLRASAGNCGEQTCLTGRRSSPAASLDDALFKKPRWMSDIFGADREGRPILLRLLRRSNPGQKRDEPTIVAMKPGSIEVEAFLKDRRLTEPQELEHLAVNIEAGWKKRRVPSRVTLLSTPEPLRKGADNTESGHAFPWPFGLTDVKGAIKDAFLKEVATALQDTDIFNRFRYRRLTAEILNSRLFKKMRSSAKTLVHGLDAGLCTTARLGAGIGGLPKEPLRITLPPTLSASVTILYYLRDFKRFPITIDYHLAIAKDFITRLDGGMGSVEWPHACVLPLGTALMLLSGKHPTRYSPFMLMPRTSHRIVSARTPRTDKGSAKRGSFAFFKSAPSTAEMYFDDIEERGWIDKRRSEVLDLAPDEATTLLFEGANELHAIQWFPIYEFNRLFCNCISEEASPGLDKATVLFVHESLLADTASMLALDIALRDAWLDLRVEPGIREAVVSQLLQDRDYLKFLGRCGGLFNLPVRAFQEYSYEKRL